jgi:hypothetical protein
VLQALLHQVTQVLLAVLQLDTLQVVAVEVDAFLLLTAMVGLVPLVVELLVALVLLA